MQVALLSLPLLLLLHDCSHVCLSAFRPVASPFMTRCASAGDLMTPFQQNKQATADPAPGPSFYLYQQARLSLMTAAIVFFGSYAVLSETCVLICNLQLHVLHYECSLLYVVCHR